MAFFDEESLSSTYTLLEKGQLPIEQTGVGPQSRSCCWNLREIWALRKSVLIHLGFVALYTIVYVAETGRIVRQNAHGPNILYCERHVAKVRDGTNSSYPAAPAHESINWGKKYINNDVDSVNPYKGPPRPELDEVWHDLFICTSIDYLRSISSLKFTFDRQQYSDNARRT